MPETATENAVVTLNEEQRLYVIPASHGYSCLGFDVCAAWTKGILDWLKAENAGMQVPAVVSLARIYKICNPNVGTPEAYKFYEKVSKAGWEFNKATGKRCEFHLIPELKGLEGKRVEVIDCYGEKRRFYVGKSTGWMPCHLEIAKRNSSGGGSVTGTPLKSVKVITGMKRR